MMLAGLLITLALILALLLTLALLWGFQMLTRLNRSRAQTAALVRQAAESERANVDAILRNMAEGVLLVDSTKKVLLINLAAEAILKIRSHAPVGQDHLDVTHHFDLEERIDRVLATMEPLVFELKRAQPEPQIFECRLTPTGDSGGEVQGVLVVLRDITQFRKLEQMRTEFVANVTHELRTPLTAIRGFAETLLEGALDEPEEAIRFVGIIKRESEQLGRLIADLLDLSRIESGKMKMHKEPVELQQLLDDTITRLAPRAAEAGVTLTLKTDRPFPPVPGDIGRLSQVLINLVDNALKYTPSGGWITVSGRMTADSVVISVADSGVGIPKADLPRIFERFYRVDKARTRATGGTGLGLAIVKHIIDAHGGTIAVVSDTGQGAAFTITLPRHHASLSREE